MNPSNTHHTTADAAVRVFCSNRVPISSGFFQITPTPSANESKAIAAALGMLEATHRASDAITQSWWREGLESALNLDAEK